MLIQITYCPDEIDDVERLQSVIRRELFRFMNDSPEIELIVSTDDPSEYPSGDGFLHDNDT